MRLWSSLAKRTKARYAKQGVTPARYNAWQRLTPAKRKGLDRETYLTTTARRPQAAARRAPAHPVGSVLYIARLAEAKWDMLNAHPDVRFVSATTILNNMIQADAATLRKMEKTDADQWREYASEQRLANPWYYR